MTIAVIPAMELSTCLFISALIR